MLSSAEFVADPTKDLVVAMDLFADPVSGFARYNDAEHVIEGFDVEMACHLAQALRRRLVLRHAPLHSLPALLRAGGADLALGKFDFTEPRSRSLPLLPYFDLDDATAGRRRHWTIYLSTEYDDDECETTDCMAWLARRSKTAPRVAVLRGSAEEDWLSDQAASQGLKVDIVRVTASTDAATMLVEKRLDAYLGVGIDDSHGLVERHLPMKEAVGPASILLATSTPRMVRQLGRCLRELATRGVLAEIANRTVKGRWMRQGYRAPWQDPPMA